MTSTTSEPRRRIGRPCKPDDERRDFKIQVRCTADEYNRWLQAAQNAGISMAEYLRRCESQTQSRHVEADCTS